MSVNTHLPGRLRNTPLPRSHGLLPLFEAVVNSIHSIAELKGPAGRGSIRVGIVRAPQSTLPLDDSKGKRGAPPQENITGFRIVDNGVGFHDRNMQSFETLDSEYKASQGCRGVGRLLWLKAFQAVYVTSVFRSQNGALRARSFSFTASQGIMQRQSCTVTDEPLQTSVHLDGFFKPYREKSAKTARKIANSIFEHCLWYFVRDGGAPGIVLVDGDEVIDLADVYAEYMYSSSKKEHLEIKGRAFELTHLKLKSSAANQHFIAWCAANRVVEEETMSGKIAGLHGKVKDDNGEFVYACYVSSPFLDENVRPERIGFDIEEIADDLFSATELSLADIRSAIVEHASRYLDGYLKQSRRAGLARVEQFVSSRAPNYRPILRRIVDEKLSVDPEISDKDLDLLLHRHLSDIESAVLCEGHSIMEVGQDESSGDYQRRLGEYLSKVDDIKKSDLAGYVFHRKIVLDILARALERGDNGRYAHEQVIHELIMPLRKTSNDVRLDSCNLWLIDERLAFHDFLASDTPLAAIPVTGSASTKEPDLFALNVYDEPILFSEGKNVPLASIVIVEIKRPMRNDAAAGEEKDPVEQALGYLDRIRSGGVKTAAGRPIPRSDEVPGFCYVICDLTSSIERRCKTMGLTVTSDHMGYFGYNSNYRAYIEVISYDRLLLSARQRNRAFFDRLGLPNS